MHDIRKPELVKRKGIAKLLDLTMQGLDQQFLSHVKGLTGKLKTGVGNDPRAIGKIFLESLTR